MHDVRGKTLKGEEIQLADACLNDVIDLTLLEMKAVWIRDTVILDDNHERYLDHLCERYGIGAAGDRPRGIGQLAKTISSLASKAWIPIDQDFGQVKMIYPVLLVYDVLIDTPVHTSFLASEFRNALEPDATLQDGTMRKGRFRIAPLTIMTIELLESLETSLKHFRLVGLLRDYTSSCPDRIVSLHNFIAASPQYRSKMYASKSVASTALETLTEAQQRLFPSSSVPISKD